MLPPAPGRLSTMTCCPHASVSFCPTSRARMSVAPPGGNGTTIRIGLVGYAGACAPAGGTIADRAASRASSETRSFMSSLGSVVKRVRQGLHAPLVFEPDALQLVDLRAGGFHDARVLG